MKWMVGILLSNNSKLWYWLWILIPQWVLLLISNHTIRIGWNCDRMEFIDWELKCTKVEVNDYFG